MMSAAKTTTKGSNSNENQNKFCWICHKHGADINCLNCPRWFHKCCLSGTDTQSNQQSLQTTASSIFILRGCQCLKIQNARKVCEIDKDTLNRALKYLIQKLLDDDEYKELNEILKRDIMSPLDLNVMDGKIDQRTYLTSVEFLFDILWLEHNCLIVDPSHRMKRITKEFVKFVKEEIFDIEQCEECYGLANQKRKDWFSIPCNKKHPLAWAKVVGFPYEPAKVMSVKNGEFIVYFFGDHKRSTLPPKFCFGFSAKSPNAPSWKMDPGTLKEVDAYIEKLGTSFQYTKFKQQFDPKLLEPVNKPVEAQLSNNSRKQPSEVQPSINFPRPLVEAKPENPVESQLSNNIRKPPVGEKPKNTVEAQPSNNFQKPPVEANPIEPLSSYVYRNAIISLLDQREEQFTCLLTLNKQFKIKEEQFKSKEEEFKLKEEKFLAELTEFKSKVTSLKRQHEKELERSIVETKKKKWCTECHGATVVELPIFCNVTCGLKWHQKTSSTCSSHK